MLAGGGRKLWVWQNRTAWTNHPGSAFTVADIPVGVKKLNVYAWDRRKKTIPESSQTMRIEDLAGEQTWMITAAPDDGIAGQLKSTHQAFETLAGGLRDSLLVSIRKAGSPASVRVRLYDIPAEPREGRRPAGRPEH